MQKCCFWGFFFQSKIHTILTSKCENFPVLSNFPTKHYPEIKISISSYLQFFIPCVLCSKAREKETKHCFEWIVQARWKDLENLWNALYWKFVSKILRLLRRKKNRILRNQVMRFIKQFNTANYFDASPSDFMKLSPTNYVNLFKLILCKFQLIFLSHITNSWIHLEKKTTTT